jgi:hypothetical protein
MAKRLSLVFLITFLAGYLALCIGEVTGLLTMMIGLGAACLMGLVSRHVGHN